MVRAGRLVLIIPRLHRALAEVLEVVAAVMVVAVQALALAVPVPEVLLGYMAAVGV